MIQVLDKNGNEKGTSGPLQVLDKNGNAKFIDPGTGYITLTSLSATPPILYNNLTGVFSLPSGNLTDSGTDGIIITNGAGSVIGAGTSIAQHVSDSTHNGYLSSADWIIFDGKPSGSGTLNTYPLWTGPNTLGDGFLTQVGANIHLQDANLFASHDDLATISLLGNQGHGDAYVVLASGASNVYVTQNDVNIENGNDSLIIQDSATTLYTKTAFNLISNNAGGFSSFLDGVGLTANRTYTFPNKSGTFALTSDLTGGTVTSVAWTTSQGVSASIATSTTTPNITVHLGALTGVTSFNGLVVTANTGAITTGSYAATIIPTAYTQAQIISVSGVTNRTTITGTSTVPIIDISAAYIGQASITTLGTVTTGTLSTGSVIAGVTMTLGSDANYDIYYRNSSGVLTRLGNGTTGQMLTATTGAAPSWMNPATSGTVTSVAWTTSQGVSASVATFTTTPNITITLGALTGVTSFNGLVVTANTGVITTGTMGTGSVISGTTMTLGSDANYDMYYRNSSGVLTRLANGTTGQVLTATTSAAPSWATAGGGSGTVTSVSVVTNQGVSGSVATATTTPAITLTLGALTGVTSFNGLIVTANTGAITTGSWAATAIPAANGGTGQTVYTIGDILYASTTTALSKLSAGAAGKMYMCNGVGSAPIITPFTFPTGGFSANAVLFASSAQTIGNTTALTFDGNTLLVDNINGAGTARHVINADGKCTSTAFGTSVSIDIINYDTTANNFASLNFIQAKGTQATAEIDVKFTDRTNQYGDMMFSTRSAAGFSQKLYIMSTGQIGTNTATPVAMFEVNGGQSLASWTTNGVQFRLPQAIFTDTDTAGTRATASTSSFAVPTLKGTNAVTITDSYNVYIAGTPFASTNITQTRAWALTIAAGNSNFAGSVYHGALSVTPTALVHIAAGTATANTSPIKLTSGTNLTVAEAGVFAEYDGTNFFGTPNTTVGRWAHSFNSVQYATPATGNTVVTTAGMAQLVCNPAGTLLALTIDFPASPINGQTFGISISQIITTLTLATTDGSTIDGTITTSSINSNGGWVYIASVTTWFKTH